MFRRLIAGLPVALAVSSATAFACSPIIPEPELPMPILPRLVDEGAEAYEHRVALARLEFQHQRALKRAEESSYERGYDLGYETALWGSARIAAVVEVLSSEPVEDDLPAGYGTPLVTLKVIHAAKGNPSRRPFTLRYEGITYCGPYPHSSLLGGRPGERFLIFADARMPSMDTITASYSSDAVKTDRSKSLFEHLKGPAQ